MCIDEFNGDNFDHGRFGFVGGGYMGQVQTNGRPIQTTSVPPGTPKWGAKWKSAVRDNYLSTVTPGTGVHGSFYSYRDVYLDLDPLYKDQFGRPLVRITIDFHDNEIKQNAYLTDKFAEIIKAMGAKEVDKQYRKAPYDVTKYQTTHLCGGAIMGTDPWNGFARKLIGEKIGDGHVRLFRAVDRAHGAIAGIGSITPGSLSPSPVRLTRFETSHSQSADFGASFKNAKCGMRSS